MIENVPNVVADSKGVVQTSIALLQDAGYHVTSAVLAANKLGWPQTRRRFFLVASRDTVPLDLKLIARANEREALPVSWALRDTLDSVVPVEVDIMNSIPALSNDNLKRVAYLFENDEYDMPNSIRPDCHKDGTTYAASYGRMAWNSPAPTITGGFMTPGRGRFLHPKLPRVLTPREAARIQGFPDWFDFVVDERTPPARAELSRWIGNAVPSNLGFFATLAALGGQVEAEHGRHELPLKD